MSETEQHVCKPSCHNPCLLDDDKPKPTERERARQTACAILPIPYLKMGEFIEHAASVATAFALSETAALREQFAREQNSHDAEIYRIAEKVGLPDPPSATIEDICKSIEKARARVVELERALAAIANTSCDDQHECLEIVRTEARRLLAGKEQPNG